MTQPVDAKYAQEQAKLRARHDGTLDPDEINIPPPREPEVNPEIYKDVEPLLSKGFLTLPAEINGVVFVFKSLNNHEFEMLGFMAGASDREATQDFWNMFLAYGVFMVDGTNVLEDRARALKDIARMFADFTPGARTRLVRHLSELNRRANVATILTEPYATEPYSRHRWAQIRGLDLMSATVTGVSGTEKLGLNFAQRTWRALNHYEDLSEQMEREWENAKFVGACMAGKGISKVHSSDERRRAKQKEMLMARKDAVIRHAIFGEDPETGKQQKGDKVVFVAHTAEELSAQLQASLRGEKDWHDTVVEAYEKQIRARYIEQERKLKQMLEQHKAEFEGKNLVGSTDLHGLTPGEVAERVTRRKQLEAQSIAQRVVYPQLQEGQQAHLRKWGFVGGPEVASTITSTDRDPTQAVPISLPEAIGRPFRR